MAAKFRLTEHRPPPKCNGQVRPVIGVPPGGWVCLKCGRLYLVPPNRGRRCIRRKEDYAATG